MMANNQGIITRTFPPTERGRALGINGTFVALGSLVGPALGGIILSFASWKYLFWINVPIGIIIYILSLKLHPSHTQTESQRVDYKGAILFFLFIIPLFAALEEVQVIGIKNPLVIAFLAVAAVSFIYFILVERKHEAPLLQLKIFKNVWFSVSLVCSFLSFIAIFVSVIILPFYLQDILKMSPGTTGLYMTIYPLVMALAAPVSGHISDKIGSEILTLIGLGVTALGLFLMSTLDRHPSFVIMGIFIAMMSLGNALFQSPNTSLIMSTVKREYLGIGGSVNALIRNLGMAVGIVLSTSVLYGGMSAKLGYHVSGFSSGLENAFIYGMRLAYIIAALISLIGAIITAIRLYKIKTTAKI
jgi:EmrB/QacA subfamily drug resistance transporter